MNSRDDKSLSAAVEGSASTVVAADLDSLPGVVSSVLVTTTVPYVLATLIGVSYDVLGPVLASSTVAIVASSADRL